MTRKIGVGIIGASEQSWAQTAHIPALQSLSEFELRAVSTSRPESARQAERALKVRAFDNHRDLVNQSDVELVVVAVKVPYHHELVCAAIEAGKSIYCEWPLARNAAEAEQLTQRAAERRVASFVGLQGRVSPVFSYVRDLLKEGYVGELQSVSLLGSGMYWGGVFDKAHAYLADRSTGATMFTIPFGHTVDAVCSCVGEFSEVSALLANRRESFTLAETGEHFPMTAHDQVMVLGKLEGGAVAALHYRGSASPATNFLCEINGAAGDLIIRSESGHTQLSELRLEGRQGTQDKLSALPAPDKYRWAPSTVPNIAYNVAQNYRYVARDLREGTHLVPTFADGLARHRMLEAIEEAGASGQRQLIKRAFGSQGAVDMSYASRQW
jgi:predicted dehydrogenase